MPQVAERIGHYEILGTVGQGAMGTVLEGYDEALDRRVAVKVLAQRHAREEEFRKRFLREARAVAKINHPNVAQIYQAAFEADVLFYAMELVDGDTLDALLDKPGSANPLELLELLLQAADGLEEAHRHGVIHRDIKPGNLMRTKLGRIKIVDFGLALFETTDPRVTASGEVFGTPYYMSPEQAQAMPLDQRSDMYALGATFYHLLAGNPLFDAPSAMGIVLKHVNDERTPLCVRCPDVPPELGAVVDRMVKKLPQDRYPDYASLRQDLRAARDAIVSRETTLIVGELVPAVDTAPAPPASSVRVSILALLLALVMLFAGGLTATRLRGRGATCVPSPAPAPPMSRMPVAPAAPAAPR